MANITWNKFNVFTKDLLEGKHDFTGATFKVMLTNTAPVATNTVKANITDISAGNGYTAGGATLTKVVSTASGVAKLTVTDAVITASGGSVGPYRYAVIYNDTQSSPAKPLVGWLDLGQNTLATGESETIDFDGTNGLFTVA